MKEKYSKKTITHDDDIILDNNFSTFLSTLPNKIHSGDFKIAVYGLGHVGSPIAAAWLRAGASVIGVDKSEIILQKARDGTTHIPEPGVGNAYTKGLENQKFFVYNDLLKASQDSFLKMICVPV